MKKVNITITVVAIICMAFLASCGGAGSTSANADPVVSENSSSIVVDGSGARLDADTELETAFNGLTFKDVYILDGDGKKISNREVALNTDFSIVYEGVKNYSLKDGKASPSLSIQVIDNNQNTVINEIDQLSSNPEGLSEADASVLRATIGVRDPIKPGKYICSILVVDKNNSDAAITSTWSFEVK